MGGGLVIVEMEKGFDVGCVDVCEIEVFGFLIDMVDGVE